MSSKLKPSTACQASASKISETKLVVAISRRPLIAVRRDYNRSPRSCHAHPMFDWWRRLSRADVIAEPFPERFDELIRRGVPCAELLTDAELRKLEALVRIFNSEKTFEGAGGLELDEEMRVVIAARACLLVLGRVELDGPLYAG